MAPEIIYSETSTGVFEPQLTAAKKRRAKRGADKLRLARRERWEAILGVSMLIIAILLWVAFNVAFGYFSAHWPA